MGWFPPILVVVLVPCLLSTTMAAESSSCSAWVVAKHNCQGDWVDAPRCPAIPSGPGYHGSAPPPLQIRSCQWPAPQGVFCRAECEQPFASYPPSCVAGVLGPDSACEWEATSLGHDCASLRCVPHCTTAPAVKGNGTVVVHPPTAARSNSVYTAGAMCDVGFAPFGLCECQANSSRQGERASTPLLPTPVHETEPTFGAHSSHSLVASWVSATNSSQCDLACAKCAPPPAVDNGRTLPMQRCGTPAASSTCVTFVCDFLYAQVGSTMPYGADGSCTYVATGPHATTLVSTANRTRGCDMRCGRCPSPPTVGNGTVSESAYPPWSPSSNQLVTIASLSCGDGFVPGGSTACRCTASEAGLTNATKWVDFDEDGDPFTDSPCDMTCTSCPAVPRVAHGVVAVSSNGLQITLQCDADAVPLRDSTATCQCAIQDSGTTKWYELFDGYRMNCDMQCGQCPPVPEVSNGTVSLSTSPGAAPAITLQCARGTVPEGPATCRCDSTVDGTTQWVDPTDGSPCNMACGEYPLCPALPRQNGELTVTEHGVARPGMYNSVGTRLTWICDPGHCFLDENGAGFGGGLGLCAVTALHLTCTGLRDASSLGSMWLTDDSPQADEASLTLGCVKAKLRCPTLANFTDTSATACTTNGTLVPYGGVCTTACYAGTELEEGGEEESGERSNEHEDLTAMAATCELPTGPNASVVVPGGFGVWSAPVPVCVKPEEEEGVASAAVGVSVLGLALSALHSLMGATDGTYRVPAASVRQHVALGHHMYSLGVISDMQGGSPPSIDSFTDRLAWSAGGIDMGSLPESLSDFFDGLGGDDGDEDGDEDGDGEGGDEPFEPIEAKFNADRGFLPRQPRRFMRGKPTQSTSRSHSAATSPRAWPGLGRRLKGDTNVEVPPGFLGAVRACSGALAPPQTPVQDSVAEPLHVEAGTAVGLAVEITVLAVILAVALMCLFGITSSQVCISGKAGECIDHTMISGAIMTWHTAHQFFLALYPTFTAISLAMLPNTNAVAWLIIFSGAIGLWVLVAAGVLALSARAARARHKRSNKRRKRGSASAPKEEEEAERDIHEFDGPEWPEVKLRPSSASHACMCWPVFRESRATPGSVACFAVVFLLDNIVRPFLIVQLYTRPVASVVSLAAVHALVAVLFATAMPKREMEWEEANESGPVGCCVTRLTHHAPLTAGAGAGPRQPHHKAGCTPQRCCCTAVRVPAKLAFWLVLTNRGEAVLRLVECTGVLLALAFTADALTCVPNSAATRESAAQAIESLEISTVLLHVATSLMSMAHTLWMLRCCRRVRGRRRGRTGEQRARHGRAQEDLDGLEHPQLAHMEARQGRSSSVVAAARQSRQRAKAQLMRHCPCCQRCCVSAGPHDAPGYTKLSDTHPGGALALSPTTTR